MNVKNVLLDHNFKFKKKFGQNFLIDGNILDNIIKVSDIKKNTLVIEIGVGAASLTKKLCEISSFVLGYEIDESLKDPLKNILSTYDNYNIIFDDFLNRDIKKDIENYDYDKLMVISNLPYYITTPIITKFINEKINVSKMVVMVQNEVADRFNASVGTKNYNSLSIFLSYYFDIHKAFFVSRNSFYPKPNVDSAVVVFTQKKQKIPLLNEEIFFKLIKDSFKQKRKTLKNNLNCYDLSIIENFLQSCGKNINFRAENITIEEFAQISNLIAKQKNV